MYNSVTQNYQTNGNASLIGRLFWWSNRGKNALYNSIKDIKSLRILPKYMFIWLICYCIRSYKITSSIKNTKSIITPPTISHSWVEEHYKIQHCWKLCNCTPLYLCIQSEIQYSLGMRQTTKHKTSRGWLK